MKGLVLKFVTIFSVTFLAVNSTFASSADLKKKQAEIKSTTNETSKLLEQTKNEKSAALVAVDEFDQQLSVANEEFEKINLDLENTMKLLKITEEELKAAEDKREESYITLKERVKFMYVNGKMGYIQALLNANSVGDFLNRLEYINKIINYDYNMLTNFQKNEELIEQKFNETEQHKKDVQILAIQQQQKLQTLQEYLDEKKRLVDKLTADEQKYKQQINDLDKSNKELEELIKQRQREEAAKASTNFVYTGGKLAWPVPSKMNITSEYGNRVNPISKKKEFHTGIDIGAPTGTSIVSAEAGVVIFAGVKSGFGNVVVVDHGSGLSTMYAHNSKLLVVVGQKVKRGETIAKAGSTGYSTGPHLHFEVRVNGATTNPVTYLK